MCSLCITSITNINARLSAGKRTRQVFAQCAGVSLRRKCVNVSICVYISVFCKDSQKDSTRARSDKRVGVIHATQRRKCALGTINIEASKLGRLGILLARLYSSRETEYAF